MQKIVTVINWFLAYHDKSFTQVLFCRIKARTCHKYCLKLIKYFNVKHIVNISLLMQSAKLRWAKDACRNVCRIRDWFMFGSRVPIVLHLPGGLVRQNVRVSLCVTWRQLLSTCAKGNPFCLTPQHQHSTAKLWRAFLIFHFKWELLALDPESEVQAQNYQPALEHYRSGNLKVQPFFPICIKVTKYQTGTSSAYQSALFRNLDAFSRLRFEKVQLLPQEKSLKQLPLI